MRLSPGVSVPLLALLASPVAAGSVPSSPASPAPAAPGTPPRLVPQSGHAEIVWEVSFSPDGRRVVTTAESVGVWDVQTGALLLRIVGTDGRWSSARFSADGRRILAVGERDASAWDAGTGERFARFGGDATLTFSADGAHVVTGSEDGLWLWKVGPSTRRALQDSATGVTHAEFSADALKIVGWGDGDATVWDASSGELRFRIGGGEDRVGEARFSPDGAQLVVSRGGRVEVWDTRSGALLRELGGDLGYDTRLSYSPDGSRVAARSDSGEIVLWRADTGALERRLAGSRGDGAPAFSSDGQLAAANTDGTVSVWDVRTGELSRTIEAHRKAVRSLSFSPDGRQLATAGDDRTSAVWDARSWVVTDPAGRLDAGAPGALDALGWVVGDRYVPLSALGAPYREPGLLASALGFRTTPPREVPPLSAAHP